MKIISFWIDRLIISLGYHSIISFNFKIYFNIILHYILFYFLVLMRKEWVIINFLLGIVLCFFLTRSRSEVRTHIFLFYFRRKILHHLLLYLFFFFIITYLIFNLIVFLFCFVFCFFFFLVVISIQLINFVCFIPIYTHIISSTIEEKIWNNNKKNVLSNIAFGLKTK